MLDATYILLAYKAHNQDKVSETPATRMRDGDADKEGKTSSRVEGKATQHTAQPRYTMTMRVKEK
jgi:hypothetical protein